MPDRTYNGDKKPMRGEMEGRERRGSETRDVRRVRHVSVVGVSEMSRRQSYRTGTLRATDFAP